MSDPTTPPPPPGNYGGSAPPPPNYGTPAPGGYGAPQPHPQGTLILILGILSIPCCGIILGPITIYLANKAQAEMGPNQSQYSNASMIQVGKILGIIGTVVSILAIIFQIFQYSQAGV